MADITFFEFHFDDTAFNASSGRTPTVADEVTFEAEPNADADGEAGGGPGPGLGAVVAVFVGLAFLLAVAYVAKGRFLDDDEGEDDEGYTYDG